jgi:putative copper resistance protein D
MCDCSTISWWLAAWRAGHFLACLLPVGLLAFHLLVAAPAFGARSVFSRAAAAVILCSLVVALVSGAAWLLIVAGNIGDTTPMDAWRSGVVTAVLGKTHFGVIWCWRVVPWIVAAAASVLMLFRPSKVLNWLCFLASAALLGMLAWSGHGLDGDGKTVYVHVTCDMVHLIVGGIWPFGLLPFAMALIRLRSQDGPATWNLAGALTRRFSNIALLCVAALALTGTVNCCFMLPSVSSLWQSGYGRVLSLKIGLFAVMIVFAVLNRFVLKPRLIGGENISATLAQLRINVLIEFALGTAVILAVAVLGLLMPPMPMPMP